MGCVTWTKKFFVFFDFVFACCTFVVLTPPSPSFFSFITLSHHAYKKHNFIFFFSSTQMASCNAATSSLLMARNMLKSAVPTISTTSSLPGPRVQLHTDVLAQAREAYSLSPSAPKSFDTPPGLEFLQSIFQGSLSLVGYGLERLQRLLTLAGDMGKRLLDIIESHPTRAALVATGVLLVVATGAAYKFILIKGSKGNELLQLPPNHHQLPEINPVPLEWEELELMRCPITLTPLIDPVLAADGHTYERAAIELWFQSGQRVSPMTGELLPNLNLIPNYIVRQTQEQLLGGRSITV